VQEAPQGQLQVQQISCLTTGLDSGWRLAPFSSSSSSSAAVAAATPAAAAVAALQQSLAPNISLPAGESSMHYLQLLSPSSSGAAAAATAGSSGSNAQFVPLQQGPLNFFYSRTNAGRPGQLPLLLQQQQAGSSSGIPTAADAAVAGLRDLSFEHKQSALVAEPPVDLLVLWRFQPTAAGSQQPAAGFPVGHQQQQQRVGLLTFYDLCAAQRLNPVRMTLEGPTALNPSHQQSQQQISSSKASIKHDFRAASMCIIPLRLKLRNCGVVAVTVTVRASDAWQGLGSEHAWFCAPSAPGAKQPGLLGPAGSPHGSPMQQQPPAAAAAGGVQQVGYMQQGRLPGGAAAAAAGGAMGSQQQQQAGGFAPTVYTSGPPPPPPAVSADPGLPPKSRTPPTSTSGGLSALGPAAAAAADSLGLGGFNLGALAGGLASGLRFPSPGGTGGSDEGGSASSSVHGGSLMQQQVQPAAAAAGTGVTVYPATATPQAGTAVPFTATATAVASVIGARGGASPQRYPPGPLAAAAAAAATAGNAPYSQQGPYGSQGAQQQQQEVQAGLPPGPDHVWCGVTRVTLESLQPGGSADVALQVAVFRPGVYVIDDYVVDWVAEGVAGARRQQGSKMGEPAVLRVNAV
jgi:hypothetical protein